MRNDSRRSSTDPPAFLVDRSKRGTFLNGVRIKSNTYNHLQTGDVVTFAPPSSAAEEERRPGLEDTTLVFSSAEEDVRSEFYRDYYVFGRTLGAGASAEVRKCRNRRSGKVMAVKIVHLTKFTSPKFLKSVQNEVPLLRKLDHPNIVKFEAIYSDPQELYIVLELFVTHTPHHHNHNSNSNSKTRQVSQTE